MHRTLMRRSQKLMKRSKRRVMGGGLPLLPKKPNMKEPINNYKIQAHEKCPYCWGSVAKVKKEYKQWEQLVKKSDQSKDV
jgi:hypothetical protein